MFEPAGYRLGPARDRVDALLFEDLAPPRRGLTPAQVLDEAMNAIDVTLIRLTGQP